MWQMLFESGIIDTIVAYPLWSSFLVALASLKAYHQLVVIQPPQLYCHQPFKVFLQDNLPILKEKYKPTIWAYCASLQTTFTSIFKSTLPDINYRREILKLSDGGEVLLDWLDNEDCDKENNENKPTVLCLPGLTGSSQSEYLKTFVNIAQFEVNARCVVFNFRGCGGHDLKTPKTYSATNTEDLSAVIDHLKKLHPTSPIMGIGVSMGGIILSNYLVQKAEAVKGRLVAAFTVSMCWDTMKGTESLEKWGPNLLLNRHLTKSLISTVRKFKHVFDNTKEWDWGKVFSSKTLREFDQSFTVKQFGYNNVEEYYQHASVAGKIKHIKIPLLALNAEDDPCQPGESLPVKEAASSTNVAILATKYGGHIGFMEGWLPARYNFSDRLFSQFAKTVLRNPEAISQFEN